MSIVLPEDIEELALTIEGKKRKLRKTHFEHLGQGLGLTDRQIQGVFKRMLKNKSKAITWIDNSFLSDDMKTAYKGILETRYERLI